MHKLERNSVPVPSPLVSSVDGKRYADLHGAEKVEIRAALLRIQGDRCAYCERRTGADPKDGHIEHFRNQADNRHLETTWNNLFWSCNDENTCGKYKDKCSRNSGPQAKFKPEDLVDPCSDNPDVFLLFVADGTVRACETLSDADRRRADETLRVFHLAGSPFLRRMREDAVRPFINALEVLQVGDPQLFVAYAKRELSRLDSLPFPTAIRHFLEGAIL